MEKEKNALEVLIGDLPEHKIKGVDGKEYVFTRIDLYDIRELINKYGDVANASLDEMVKKAEGKSTPEIIIEAIDYYMFVAWLGIRKYGLTDEQLAKRQWKISIEKMARILPNNIQFLKSLTDKIFEMSGQGIEVDSGKGNPGLDEEEKNSSREGKNPPQKTE